MKIESYGISNVGMKRTQNEDSYLINDEIHLYIVSDCTGGHLGGEYASKVAVHTVEEVMRIFRFDPEVTMISGVNTEECNPGDQLTHAIQEAGHRIHEQAMLDENLRGMGTTAVVALFSEGKLYIAHVGDSRAYRLRNGKIKQITEDHSLVTEQVKAGMISQEDAKAHKLKNIITRSVGYQEEVDIDVTPCELEVGDRFLLCSDGLSNLIEDGEMEEILKNHEIREACEKLVNTANSRGGDDNITALALQVDEI